MRYPPTIDACENVLRILGHEWRGEWQREAVQACCEHPEVVIQGCRQVFGKDFSVGIFEAARIIAGNTGTVAFPTMTQGTRLLGETIIKNVNRFGDAMTAQTGSKFWKKSREQTTYQKWALREDPTHEGKLYVLSGNEISSHVPEGYTTHDLMFNESHRNTEKILGIFEPFNLVAMQEGNSRSIYMGVGGHKASLIEKMKQLPGVKVIRYPASDIAALAPEWIPTFEHFERKLPPWQYRMHFECEQSSEGLLLMFPEGIPEALDFVSFVEKNIRPVHFFGIDLGKKVDATIVKVISVVHGVEGKLINEVDEFVIPPANISYVEQEAMIHAWIDKNYYWRRENIILELSGVGESVYDIFQAAHFRGCRGIYTTADLKKQFWHDMTKAIREGRFGCKHEKCRAEYESMTYENVFRNGRYHMEFEHTDYWMALCMAWVGSQQAEAL